MGTVDVGRGRPLLFFSRKPSWTRAMTFSGGSGCAGRDSWRRSLWGMVVGDPTVASAPCTGPPDPALHPHQGADHGARAELSAPDEDAAAEADGAAADVVKPRESRRPRMRKNILGNPLVVVLRLLSRRD
eukprot:g6732.t1